MNIQNKFRFFVVLLLVFILTPLLVGAQSENNIEGFYSRDQIDNFNKDLENTGQTSCFDYYEFGSVEARLFTESNNIVAGTNLPISIEVTNNNDYPVVETGVFLKIYRIQDDKTQRTTNGDELIDQFWAVEDLSLQSKRQKKYNVIWEVPDYVRSGKYHIDSYVVSSERYNLSGLTFTDDIAGSKIFLDILGKDDGVYFDKNSVTKNGQKHSFVSFVTNENQTGPITISADIVNTTTETQNISVNWDLYQWDGASPENKINSKVDNYSIPANSKSTIFHTVSDESKAVYYLVPTLNYKDTNSILNIRFARKGINIPRVNYPAVDTYPLKDGEEANFFVCLHNTGTEYYIDNNLFKATIKDENEKIIHEYQYEGRISGSMMGFVDSFVPQKNYGNFTIETELYSNGELIESDEVVYSCDDLGFNDCPKEVNDNNFIFIAIAGFLIIVIILLLFLKRGNSRTYLSLLILLTTLVFGSILLKDENVVAQGGPDPDILSDYPFSVSAVNRYSSGWFVGNLTNISWDASYIFQNANIWTTYYAKVKDTGSDSLLDNYDTISIGSEVEFSIKDFEDTDIYWIADLGSRYDTPFGIWTNDLVDQKSELPIEDDLCRPGDYLGEAGQGTDHFATLFVKRPTTQIDLSNSTVELDCYSVDSKTKRCLVLSSGEINAEIRFNNTEGTFWWQKATTPDARFGCYPDSTYMGYTALPWRTVGDSQRPSLFIYRPGVQTINVTLFVPNEEIVIDPPEISGPTQGFVETDYNFTITGNHPNNKQISYLIDFFNPVYTNNNLDIDFGTPSPIYTAQFTKSYSDVGIKNISAIIKDIDANSSGSSKAHNIEMFPSPTVVLGAETDSITQGGLTTLFWTSTNADTCTSNYFETSNQVSGNVDVSPDLTTEYSISCTKTLRETNEAKTVTSNKTVNVVSAPIDPAECGSDNGKEHYYTPTNLCAAGDSSFNFIQNGDNYNWICSNDNPDNVSEDNVNCLATKTDIPTDAVCGDADKPGNTYSSVQEVKDAGLCTESSETGDPVLDTDDVWKWTCSTDNPDNVSEDNVSCSAGKTSPETAKCGSANGLNFSTLKETNPNLCSKGDAINFSPNAEDWTWGCEYLDTTVNDCKADITTTNPAECGSAGDSGATSVNKPSPSLLCKIGSEIVGSVGSNSSKNPDQWIWTCKNTSSNKEIDCSASCPSNKTVIEGGSCTQPDIIVAETIMEPRVVNYNEECTIKWNFISANVNNTTCKIIDSAGTPVASYPTLTVELKGGDSPDQYFNSHKTDIVPKNSYKVSCTYTPTNLAASPVTSESLFLPCVQNPTYREF